MITITDKHNCCGCGACAERCPKDCIAMREDAEGFLYPEVDRSACICCGLCESVCPYNGKYDGREPADVLAVKNRNGGDRMASSSGGVFIALAENVVAGGGTVFGAVFDDGWQVAHTCADTVGGLRPMMGSKYVQSRVGGAYARAEKLLKEGRKVMFTGTPCQTAGLRSFLRKEYDNLLAVDIMCHGVPSPGVWRRYLEENFTNNGGTRITAINFRDKRKEGWARYNVVIRGTDGDSERELSASVYVANLFMRGFMADAYLRPSCHRCPFKHGASGGDLIIADYWGAARAVPDFADDKGVSLVVVNTEKGRKAVAAIDADMRRTTLEGEERYNGGINRAAPEGKARRRFFDGMARGLGFNAAVERALRKPAYYIMYKAITRTVRNIILKKKK